MATPEVAILEVTASKDHVIGNPYTATIVTEDGFEQGQIRIEPPVVDFGNLSDYGNDALDVTHEFTTAEATILHFSLRSDAPEFKTPKAWAKYTARMMIDELGRAASKELFTQNYINKMSKD